MGTHEALYNRQLLPLFRGEKIERPSLLFLDPQAPPELLPRYPHEGGGTSNFILMAAAGWLLWAVRYGKPLDTADAALRFHDLAQRQRREGMWLREQHACDPHAQFHLSAMIAFRMAAQEGGLSAVLAESTQQWRWLHEVYALGATPDGEVLLPCTRAGTDRNGQRTFSEPRTQVGTATFRLLAGKPHVGPAKREDWWRDPVYGGGAPQAVRKLVGNGDLFGGAAKSAEAPRLRLPLTVQRFDSGHLASLEGVKEDQPVVDWVKVEYGKPGKHAVSYGRDWTIPRPAETGRVTVVP